MSDDLTVVQRLRVHAAIGDRLEISSDVARMLVRLCDAAEERSAAANALAEAAEELADAAQAAIDRAARVQCAYYLAAGLLAVVAGGLYGLVFL